MSSIKSKLKKFPTTTNKNVTIKKREKSKNTVKKNTPSKKVGETQKSPVKENPFQDELPIKSEFEREKVRFESNIINEKKTKDSIARLITSSKNLMNQQQKILESCEELSSKLVGSEFELDKMAVLQERDDFPKFINTYSKCLGDILEKIKQNSKDIENAKYLKEENNSLRYKIDMMKIDKSDDYLNIESQINSMLNVFGNEINSMINFFIELGVKDIPINKVNNDNLNDGKIINFFALIKKLMKDMKTQILTQEEKIKQLSIDNMKFSQEAERAKMQNETFMQRKNMEPSNNAQERTSTNVVSNTKSNMMMTSNMPNMNNNLTYSTQNFKVNINNNNLGYSTNNYNMNYSYEMNKNRTNLGPFMNHSMQNVQNDMNNSTLDNYKKSKEVIYSADPNNELSLENKYTDSNFYQPNESYNYFTNSHMKMNNVTNLANASVRIPQS